MATTPPVPSPELGDLVSDDEIERAALRIHAEAIRGDQIESGPVGMAEVWHVRGWLVRPCRETMTMWLPPIFLMSEGRGIDNRTVAAHCTQDRATCIFRRAHSFKAPDGGLHVGEYRNGLDEADDLAAFLVHRRAVVTPAFRYALTGPLAQEWTAYRHRVPGSRRALALALHRTIPGTMRAFPGVGE